MNLFLMVLSMFFLTSSHTGVDSFGYRFIDSDTTGGSEFIWIDASSGDTIELADDDNRLVNLPFPFPFYRQTLRNIYVVSNGYLTSTNTRGASNIPLPASNVENLISPWWDDLNPATGGHIYTFYDTTLDAFVVQWDSVMHYRTGGPYTFEVILFHSGDIIFSYKYLNPPINSSTIGIQGGNGTNGYYLQYTVNGNPILPHDSLTIVFSRPTNVQIVDVLPTAILAPSSPIVNIGESFTPEVEVLNAGSDTSSFTVFLNILGDTTIISQSLNVNNIPPYTIDTVNFTPVIIDTNGVYEMIVRTFINGDENPQNDTIRFNFMVPAFHNDFEADSGNFYSSGGWQWGTPAVGPPGAHSGTRVWGTYLNGNYPNYANLWLIGDYIVTDSNAAFGFFQWFNFERRMDGGNVLFTINHDTTSWELLYPEGGYTSYVFALSQDGFTGTIGSWSPALFVLPTLEIDDTITIAFHVKSGRSNTASGWYLDDFYWTGLNPIPTLEIDESRNGGSEIITFRKSIVRKFLMVESNCPGEKTKAEIYDITGRMIREFEIFNGESKIYVGDLRNGIYYLRIKGGRVNGVRKFMVLK